eukprot:6413765-Amphidinium_carterae.1
MHFETIVSVSFATLVASSSVSGGICNLYGQHEDHPECTANKQPRTKTRTHLEHAQRIVNVNIQ